MAVQIHKIALGVDNSYLIQDRGLILVDAGEPDKIHLLKKALQSLSIDPQEIKLNLITHGHWDHIGSAAEIKELTGAPIAMHDREKEWLENGLKTMPPGVSRWGRFFHWLLATFAVPALTIPKVPVDIAISDTGMSLAEYGLSGKVIHTPGHSSGSISLVLPSGEAFVGDSAMNMFPMCLTPSLPIFAEDIEKLKDSWQLLLKEGARIIYPAHGSPFPVEKILKKL